VSVTWAPDAPLPEQPPGVLGYVVACITGKPSLTHASVMDRDTAEGEAALLRRAGPAGGGRYVVCEVREATE
jgi:hypothetical protein